MRGKERHQNGNHEPRRRSGPDLNTTGPYYISNIQLGPGNRIIASDPYGVDFRRRPSASAGRTGRRSGNKSRR